MKQRHKGYFNEGIVDKKRNTGQNHFIYGTQDKLTHWHKIMRYGRNESIKREKRRHRRIKRLTTEGALHG